MLTQTLDNHLKVFVSEEVQAVGAQLGRLLEAETFSKLKEDVLQRLHKSSDTCDPLRSILEIENTINKTFQKFMDITQSQPLVDLVNQFVEMLKEYGNTIHKMVNDAGGDTLRQALASLISTLDLNVKPNEKGFSFFESKWNLTDLHYFIVFVCVIFCTCRKVRELAKDIKQTAQKVRFAKFFVFLLSCSKLHAHHSKYHYQAVEEKYKQAITIKPLIDHILVIEGKLLQILCASILTKFDVLVQFQHNTEWDEERYGVEMKGRLDTWFDNCKKLLPRLVFSYFVQLFTAHFSFKYIRGLFSSKVFANITLLPSPVAGLLSLFEQTVMKELLSSATEPQLRLWQGPLKKMRVLAEQIIELGLAPAGEKYSLSSAKGNTNGNTASNFFNLLFGKTSANRPQTNLVISPTEVTSSSMSNIADTEFAKKAANFCADQQIKLDIFEYIFKYQDAFSDEDEVNQSDATDEQSDNKEDNAQKKVMLFLFCFVFFPLPSLFNLKFGMQQKKLNEPLLTTSS
ncbi:hypothetical protein RFI_39892 [Reticulomyxa filosa]|uniref:Uncharacterized protein n=1 Tax=Reticulomyxa filosa TaxID=46433 RepID=X6L8A1_RETFI|nr:hypothetical protein RFI_39892 [Reticulomyxa filosa]|eukprot:ETN97638.1 hypothetical protein RFI_39892 [Reticulomyxa filosa]